jgi:hypothetical protein
MHKVIHRKYYQKGKSSKEKEIGGMLFFVATRLMLIKSWT